MFFDAISNVKTFVSSLAGMTLKLQVFSVLVEYVPSIIDSSNLNNSEEIFIFLTESGYELLPFPVRIFLKREVFINVIGDGKDKVIEIIEYFLTGDDARDTNDLIADIEGEEAQKKIAQAEVEIERAKLQIAEAEQEILEAKKEIEKAEKQIIEVKERIL